MTRNVKARARRGRVLFRLTSLSPAFKIMNLKTFYHLITVVADNHAGSPKQTTDKTKSNKHTPTVTMTQELRTISKQISYDYT